MAGKQKKVEGIGTVSQTLTSGDFITFCTHVGKNFPTN